MTGTFNTSEMRHRISYSADSTAAYIHVGSIREARRKTIALFWGKRPAFILSDLLVLLTRLIRG
jgi:hypothetical protein